MAKKTKPKTEDPAPEAPAVDPQPDEGRDEGLAPEGGSDTPSEAEAASAPEANPATTPTQGGIGLIGAFAAGLVAAILVVLAFTILNPRSAVTDPLDARISALEDAQSAGADAARVDDLDRRLSDVESALTSDITALSDQVVALQDRLTQTQDQLTAIEQRPIADAGAAVATALQSVEDRLTTLRTDADQVRADVDALNSDLATRLAAAQETSAEAAAAAQRAANIAALNQIEAALDTGATFADSLAPLAEQAEIPPALSQVAEVGVVTLAELQDRFPAAARAALIVSIQDSTGEGLGDRLTAFFRVQTGARSLSEREGDDPDAILSRAEAALKSGRLADSLALIATLPQVGQDEMADWVQPAATRQAAVEGHAALSTQLIPQ